MTKLPDGRIQEKLPIILLLLLVAIFVAAGIGRTAIGSVSQELQMGKLNFESGHYGPALDHFFQVLLQAPENIEAKSYILRIGETWRTKEQQAILTPENREIALQEVSRLLKKRKEKLSGLEQDLETVRRQLEIGLADPQGLLQASRSLSKFKETGMEDRILAEQSQRYLQLLQEELRKAIQRNGTFQNPKDVIAARGFLWYYKGNLENALKEWNKALALAPEDSMLKEQIQWVSRKKALAERTRTIQELLQRAQSLSEKGQYDQAVLDWRSLVILEPENNEFQQSLMEAETKVLRIKANRKLTEANRAVRQGRLPYASQFFLDALEIDPGNHEALDGLKRIQQELSRRLTQTPGTRPPSPGAAPESEIKTVDRVSRSEKLSEDQYTLGLIYYSQGDAEKAQKALEVALQYDPSNEKAKNALGRIQAEILP